MSTPSDDLAERLRVIADDLGDLALERLRAAVDDAGGGGTDPRAVAEERRLTRARRAIEKAIHLLATADLDDGDA